MASRPKRTRYCQLPTPGNIAGRSSSITNAFFNAIIPIHEPSDEEVLEALKILEINSEDIRCVYCGDKSSEWDHLRPIITGQQPTGYITEIANLVPACGKCNQSKGNRDWREWMESTARLSPKTRSIADLEGRIERLILFTMWKPPTRVDFASIIDPRLWAQHQTNWRKVLDLLQESQKLAKQIHAMVGRARRHENSATGEVFYTTKDLKIDKEEGDVGFIDHEEVVARIDKILREKQATRDTLA